MNADKDTEVLMFPTAEVHSLSPRQAWLRDHGVKTNYRTDIPEESGRWEAYVGDYDESLTRTLDPAAPFYPCDSPHLAWGETEADAINNLATNNEWPACPPPEASA